MAEAAAAIGAADPGAAGAGGVGDTWTAPDWAAGLEPDILAMPKLREWKSPADAVRAYHGAQALIGADPNTVLKLPKEGDNAAWEGVYTKLGRPDTADKYDFEMPATGGDEKLAGWAKGVFHKLGLSGTQAKAFSQEWNAFNAARATEGETASAAALAEDKAALTKLWGAEESPSFKEAVAIAKAGAEQFGVSGEQIDAIQQVMGLTATLKLFNSIGAKLGEPGFAGTGGGDGAGFNGMTPERAQAEIKTYQSDPDNMKAWTDNRHPRHKEVMDHIAKLFGAAYPDGV